MKPKSILAALPACAHGLPVGAREVVQVISRKGMAALAVGLLAVPRAALLRAVFHVLLMRSKHQVVRVKARRIIATVKDMPFVSWAKAEIHHCRDAMDAVILLTERNHSIAVRIFGSTPIPASRGWIYNAVSKDTHMRKVYTKSLHERIVR